MELSCTDCSDSESASDELHPSGREPTADELALLARASSPSSWTVLANGRLGMELPQQKGIKQVYLAADGEDAALSAWDDGKRHCDVDASERSTPQVPMHQPGRPDGEPPQ